MFLVFKGLQYIHSQRKRPLLIVNDFLYRRNRQNYWRCIRSTSQKCRASLIITDNDLVTLCITDHTHPAEMEKLRNREKKVFNSSVLETLPPPKRSFKIDKVDENSN